jgi:hypothetical protein
MGAKLHPCPRFVSNEGESSHISLFELKVRSNHRVVLPRPMLGICVRVVSPGPDASYMEPSWLTEWKILQGEGMWRAKLRGIEEEAGSSQRTNEHARKSLSTGTRNHNGPSKRILPMSGKGR